MTSLEEKGSALSRRATAFGFFVMIVLWTTFGPALAAGDKSDDCDGAVYEYKRWECLLKDDKATLHGKWRVRILNRRGAEYANVSLSETPFVRLKKVKATRFDGDGREELCLSKKDFTKACGFGSISIYDDNCQYYADLSSKRYPYTIEVESEEEIKSLFGWHRESFQAYIPVDRAEYTLVVDSDVPFRYRCVGGDLEPVISEVGGKQQYVWALDSIPALEKYDYLPSWENEPIHLEFCADRFSFEDFPYEGSSWNDIGEWYLGLCQGRGLAAASPVPPSEPKDARELLESIYRDVRESTRYVSISIGIGGWRPHSASSTVKNGYGDCKDMSNLLVSRLRNAGIEAYPALVMTRDEGRTDSTFPNHDFNHVIAMAVLGGTDTVWMDATSDWCPFGALPTGDQNAVVVVATDEGGLLCQTPKSHHSDNVIERISRWTIKEDLMVTFKCELMVSGAYASSLRARLSGLDADDERSLVERQFDKAGKTYTIADYSIEKLQEIDQPLVVKVMGHTIKPSRKLRGAAYFDPLQLTALGSLLQTDVTDRPVSLNTYWPETVIDRVSVTWDPTLSVDSVIGPASDSLRYSFGHLAITSSQYDDSAKVCLTKATYDYVIDTSAFAEFQEFQSAARKIYDRRLKLFVQ